MTQTIQDYREALDIQGKEWLDHVLNHLREKHSEYELVLFYRRPVLKVNREIFLMMGGGKNHFSIYTTDFDYVDIIKAEKNKGLKFGKSAILFPLDKKEYMSKALRICDEVILRAEKA
ncbi:MAG: hypothetical protein Q7I99_04270 [Acholeplasmataceae bacterium]|nr:hypothetical protein [Acholeplasmataceae bacterium]